MTDYSFDAEVKSYGFCMGSVKVVVALGVWCGKAKNELCFRTKWNTKKPSNWLLMRLGFFLIMF